MPMCLVVPLLLLAQPKPGLVVFNVEGEGAIEENFALALSDAIPGELASCRLQDAQ